MKKLLDAADSFEKKNVLLLRHVEMDKIVAALPWLDDAVKHMSEEEKSVLYQAIFLDKGRLVPRLPVDISEKELRHRFLDCMAALLEVDRFYSSIGGLIGYQVEALHHIYDRQHKSKDVLHSYTSHLPPPFSDMRNDSQEFWDYVYQGTVALSECAEFHAVGGAGDRLNLIDVDTNEPKPAATLKIFGKSLLEWLFDDLDAREYWCFRVTGKKVTTPVVLMTSLEKNNDLEIERLCRENNWFHRDPNSIFRVIQPLVPLIDNEGALVAKDYFQLSLKPGGHGVIWKLALDFGVYDWLHKKGISSIIVRQINNPISGMDSALLALPGQGIAENRLFGFASCTMREGFNEGLNVLEKTCDPVTKKSSYYLSNIEYVVFESLKKSNPEIFSGHCPANVNLLFANVEAIKKASHIHPFPGLIVNMKNEVEAIDETGKKKWRKAARLESTMQNISEEFSINCDRDLQSIQESLPSFVQMYDRYKILSATKKSYESLEKGFYETPVSFLYDWTSSIRKLLEKYCDASLPPKRQSIEDFLQMGPEFFMTFHPSVGPLWSIIGQKIRYLSLTEGSCFRLAIPEVYLENVSIDGACVLESELSIQKHMDSKTQPRAYLKNVRVENQGKMCVKNMATEAIISSCVHNTPFHNLSSCTIRLLGVSEVWMEDVVISGEFSLLVPDGMRAIVSSPVAGTYTIQWQTLSGQKMPSEYDWRYDIDWQKGYAPKLLFSHSYASCK